MLSLVMTSVGLPNQFRPPAVPIITHDPYFSIWSRADNATDADTTHWTGRNQAIRATVTVDNHTYRILGAGPESALPQTGLEVTATQTKFTFKNEALAVSLKFSSPLLPHNLDLFSRPVSYISLEAKTEDGTDHDISFQVSVNGAVSSNEATQAVATESKKRGNLTYSRVGTVEQPILQKRGDDLRIDWGYAYLASATKQGWDHKATSTGGDAGNTWLVASKQTKATMSASGWLMVAYDDIKSLRYFDADLKAFWRRKPRTTITSVLNQSIKDRASILGQCDKFDHELTQDADKIGGPRYAQIASLSYRQAVAGTKLVADLNGRPLLFPKENFSNGCIGTVDVIYPMAPLWLMLGGDLAKAMLVPVLDYGSSARWRFPFAPHDLGTYPHATGQVYGGGERTEDDQMPVEESGNMILIVAALADIEGNPNFAKKYWPALTKWAEYLKAKGLDPSNQLCTDDFLGHLAHNANLSVKAILALAAYGKLADQLGEKATSAEYLGLAKDYAHQWVGLATEGDQTKLAFDKAGTWSQKYNMVWDNLLGLNLYPADLKTKEMALYRSKLNPYGLPLDSRGPGMKVDWLCWTATLTGQKSDFEALISPLWDYLNETPDRVPICDWVRTDNKAMIGMIARPVLGGVFLPLLQDRNLWKSRFGQGVSSEEPWGEFPMVVKEVTVVVPSAQSISDVAQRPVWKYTTETPADGWMTESFDAKAWKEGPSGFGTEGTPGSVIGTVWNTDDIWLRREISFPKVGKKGLLLSLHHDEDAEVYINGVLAAKATGYTSSYDLVDITPAGLKAIRFGGSNLIAVHCHQTQGGQYIDLGFVRVIKPKK